MKSFEKMIRFIWHGIFYALTWKAGLKFALTCRKVVETIDLNEMPPTTMGRMRFRLHLSLCQLCKNYLATCHEIRIVARRSVKEGIRDIEIEKLNFKLLEKYARK